MRKLFAVAVLSLIGLQSHADVQTCDFASMDFKITSSLQALAQSGMLNLGIAADWKTLKFDRQLDADFPQYAGYVVSFKTLQGSLISVETYYPRNLDTGFGLSNGVTTDAGIHLSLKTVIVRDSEEVPTAKSCVIEAAQPVAYVNNTQDLLYLKSPSSTNPFNIFTMTVGTMSESMPLK